MQEVIFYSLITFFSIYGIFAFILFITDFLFDNKYLKEKTIYTIFCVKNEICKIENIVKTIIFKAYKNDVGLLDQRIIIIDLGSSDGTYELLKKLEKSEKTILVYKIEEIPKLLENL